MTPEQFAGIVSQFHKQYLTNLTQSMQMAYDTNSAAHERYCNQLVQAYKQTYKPPVTTPPKEVSLPPSSTAPAEGPVFDEVSDIDPKQLQEQILEEIKEGRA